MRYLGAVAFVAAEMVVVGAEQLIQLAGVVVIWWVPLAFGAPSFVEFQEGPSVDILPCLPLQQQLVVVAFDQMVGVGLAVEEGQRQGGVVVAAAVVEGEEVSVQQQVLPGEDELRHDLQVPMVVSVWWGHLGSKYGLPQAGQELEKQQSGGHHHLGEAQSCNPLEEMY